ncbi:MAG: PAS domain S-box protein [Bacteroidetes bacterium]|jgi:two-component system CheB/CheR fusion protein|nr:PAS domain S-box protein [Bacteroidota bacterium]
MTKKKPAPKSKDDQHTFTVVGIGASAGGLEALQEFFMNMPLNTGLTFVVIQHLSPDYKSLMDELLARYTKLQIRKAQDGMTIEKDTIYLIPPRKNLTIFHHTLYLEDQQNEKALNLPIDIFFRSLANEMKNRAIGIILSGTGSDGTLGIRSIKEVGGMVMVQDNQSAKFDGMPRSSISTGLVDYIVPPEQMPKELMDYLQHPFTEKSKSIEKVVSQNIDTFTKIMYTLRDHTGIDFSYYKKNTIIRRLERRLSVNRFNNLEQYLKLINESTREKDILYRELLIGVTRFFRDKESFDIIRNTILPQLFKDKNRKNLRFWSVGCSTGEEAYSLAILVSEYFEHANLKVDFKLFATDIDRNSIEFAGAGYYPDNIVSDIDPELLSKYFKRKDNGYQVNESIRKCIVFAVHNVLSDPPFSKMDMISCRNLFIYFQPEIQERVLSMFYFSLNIDAFLFMGSSETIGDMNKAFEAVDTKNKIFRYKRGYKPELNHDIPLPTVTRQENHLHEAQFIHRNGNARQEFISEMVENIFVPPSMVIDQNNQLVRILNDANQFLHFPKGAFTQDIFKMIDDNLKIILRNMIRNLKSGKKEVIYENITHLAGQKDLNLKVLGRTIEEPRKNEVFYLFSFVTSRKEENNVTVESIDVGTQSEERINDLERELQSTRENLQLTVEELETSNEELQSSNEELIASNEELQSTNEELQSVNEELYTVNSEYQNKIEELTQLNNDINNLLKNTNIGTLYLDRKLCIRKFTPLVSEITNIMEMDICRPIYHLDLSRLYDHFLDDINEVLEKLQPRENEIYLSKKELWYLLRIRPYRTEDNAIDGIIITFTDITTLKNAKQEADLIGDRLQLALHTGKMAWWEWDVPTGKVLYDDLKATMAGYTPGEFPDDVYKICELIHDEDYETTMLAMRNHLENKSPDYQTQYRIKTKNGDYRWFYDRGGIVEKTEDGNPLKLTGIVIDVTDLKNAELEVKRNEELLRNVMENSPVGKIMVDQDGNTVFANKKAQQILGISKNNDDQAYYDMRSVEMTDIDGNKLTKEYFPISVIKYSGQPLLNFNQILTKSGKKKILLSINGSPVKDEHEQVKGAVFSIDVHDESLKPDEP